MTTMTFLGLAAVFGAAAVALARASKAQRAPIAARRRESDGGGVR